MTPHLRPTAKAARSTRWMLLLPALLLAAACGRVGVLDQPAPLYGEKAKADYQARKAAEAQAKAHKNDDGQPETLAPDTPPVHGPAEAGPDPLSASPGQGMRPLPGAADPTATGPGPHSSRS